MKKIRNILISLVLFIFGSFLSSCDQLGDLVGGLTPGVSSSSFGGISFPFLSSSETNSSLDSSSVISDSSSIISTPISNSSSIISSNSSSIEVSTTPVSLESIAIHYHRDDNNYEPWSLWLWIDGYDGSQYFFNETEENYVVAQYKFSDLGLDLISGARHLGFIVARNPGSSWDEKDVEVDRFIDFELIEKDENNIYHIYIYNGDPTIYLDSDKNQKICYQHQNDGMYELTDSSCGEVIYKIYTCTLCHETIKEYYGFNPYHYWEYTFHWESATINNVDFTATCANCGDSISKQLVPSVTDYVEPNGSNDVYAYLYAEIELDGQIISDGYYLNITSTHSHNYVPIFNWSPNFAPELEVRFVCSEDSSHVLPESDYYYYFDILDMVPATCSNDGYIKYHGYAIYKGVTYEEEVEFTLNKEESMHMYDAEFTWDYSKPTPVSARLVCQNDNSHTEEVANLYWDLVEYVPPTCDTEGKIAHEAYFYYNGFEYRDYYEEVYPSNGHNFDNDYVCVNCGFVYENEGLVFELSEDGESYEVVSYTGGEGLVVIRSEYNGKPVTAIRNDAFNNAGNVHTVILPDTLTSIGDRAFYFCQGLVDIKLPESLNYIGVESFSCTYGLKTIEIPGSVKVIPNDAFAFSGVENVTFNEGLEEIGDFAFGRCNVLNSIYIPSTVKHIGDIAFYNCYNVESVVINENNTIYDSREGCNAIILSETNTLLYGFKTSKVPTTVTSIGTNAFNDITSLVYFEIPENVTSLGGAIFRYCNNLTWVILPKSINFINGQTFEECESLETVYYTGSEEDWSKVVIDDESSNVPLLNAKIVFNYSHGNEHNYEIEKVVVRPSAHGSGKLHKYCPCGDYIVEEIEPLGEIFDAFAIYGDKINGAYEFDNFDDTYSVYGHVVTSNDILVYTTLEKPLIEMRDCINGVEPKITISDVKASVIKIVYYDYFDQDNEKYYYSGSVNVLFNGQRLEEKLESSEVVSEGVTKSIYVYYTNSSDIGLVEIINHDNGSKLIESITCKE